MGNYLIASESVCAGHPDKIADQISDSILDAALSQDHQARVAVEVLVAKNTVVIAGELTAKATIDYDSVIRNVIKNNGYTDPTWGFYDGVKIINLIHKQSNEIATVVDVGGAGDQGIMYGYACNETAELMPLPIMMAHAICKKIDELRIDGTLSYLRPDGKAQVVIEYADDKPVSLQHITVAVPHDETTDLATVKAQIIKQVLLPIVKRFKLELPAQIIINGTGVWHMPGPASDAGITGRKIVVDSYGGVARVGGGAFSGKDPSKVDRSGAYAARYIAKNLVANKLVDRVEVSLAYYIGAKYPIIKTIDDFGTAKIPKKQIIEVADRLLDCSVRGIIDGLKLRRPIYAVTATYGHFGKPNLPWEKVAYIAIV